MSDILLFTHNEIRENTVWLPVKGDLKQKMDVNPT